MMKPLFEDANLVAVHKPAGWLSVPSSKGVADPRPVVGIELQKLLGTALFPLHRLDFEVDGVLAFAKNSTAQSQILGLWEKGKVQKIYCALTSPQSFSHWPTHVQGLLTEIPEKSPWVSYLVAGKRRAFVANHGVKSITNWEIKNQTSNQVLWELEPVTGRRHQLRIELSRRGFPIWGDTLYGGQAWVQLPNQIALTAVSLKIEGYEIIETKWSGDLWQRK